MPDALNVTEAAVSSSGAEETAVLASMLGGVALLLVGAVVLSLWVRGRTRREPTPAASLTDLAVALDEPRGKAPPPPRVLSADVLPQAVACASTPRRSSAAGWRAGDPSAEAGTAEAARRLLACLAAADASGTPLSPMSTSSHGSTQPSQLSAARPQPVPVCVRSPGVEVAAPAPVRLRGAATPATRPQALSEEDGHNAEVAARLLSVLSGSRREFSVDIR